MKKLSALLLVFTSTFSTVLFGQGGNPGNNRIPGNFLGWNGIGPAGSLDIRNNFAAQDINFLTNQTGVTGTAVQRMVIKGSGATTGFVGLNNSNPVAHIDGFSNNGPGGIEHFIKFRASDNSFNHMGMCNGASATGLMYPTFYGNIGATSNLYALQTIGAIANAQDLATNLTAITQFRSGFAETQTL